jgi:hypothetical protein
MIAAGALLVLGAISSSLTVVDRIQGQSDVLVAGSIGTLVVLAGGGGFLIWFSNRRRRR